MKNFIGWIIHPIIIMRIPLKKISFIGIMTSLCIVTNYMLIGIPNVKFMDLFTFVSGYTMGVSSGALVGVLTWLVYGTLNPYGFNLPTLAATCTGESLYGITGGLLSGKLKLETNGSRFYENLWENSLIFGVIGFLLTFTYDFFTNVVTALVFEIPLIPCLIAGIPFALIHEVSNLIIFSLLGSVIINTIQKLIGGERNYQ
ncbi:hypothetical protein CW706_06585 [Candidatus Bathyarchaeota archaeon]|nr:MAG: hypothetical protein CW706_06585 [Candidatus Bathyarchaeota archaeon]